MMDRTAVGPTTHNARNAPGDTRGLIGRPPCKVLFDSFHFKGSCYLMNQMIIDLLGFDWIDVMNLLEIPISHRGNSGSIKAGPVVSRHTTSPYGVTGKFYCRYFAESWDCLECCVRTNTVSYLLPNARPLFQTKSTVTFTSLPLVEKELDHLQEACALKPVSQSSWAELVFVVKKLDGIVRICTDSSTGLNVPLDMHQYTHLMLDDLVAKMNGVSFFTKSDLMDVCS
ncbi:uncharacterized protein DEA37_0013475 [Paragonimus westermani]|uniref:Uncharacterized protein n=1 Tax=Paragonimus westermani TaxID=34504 RepID=A0A5J4NZF5_9TREM|nr:uncharacterized protein DEA37_0013475 [Paragonimus westermani]